MLKIVGKILLYLGALILSLYLLLWLSSPWLARYFLGDFLAQKAIVLEEKSHIRYNPFTSTLRITNLEFQSQKQVQLNVNRFTLEISLLKILFEKTLKIETFILDGLMLNIEHKPEAINIAGFLMPMDTNKAQDDTPAADNNTASPPYRLLMPKLVIKNANIYYDGKSQHDFTINSLIVTKLNADAQKQQLHFALKASLDKSNIVIDSDINHSLEGLQTKNTIKLSGIDLSKFQNHIADSGIKTLSGFLTLESQPEFNHFNQQLSLKMGDSLIKLSELQLISDQVNIDSKENRLTIDSFDLNQTQNNLVAEIKHDFSSIDTHIVDKEQNTLAQWEQFQTQGVELKLTDQKPNLQVAQLTIDQLKTSEKAQQEESPIPALMTLERLIVQAIQFEDSALKIETIKIDQLDSNLIIDQQKQLATLVSPQSEPATGEAGSDQAKSTSEKEQASNTQSAFQFSIEDVVIDKTSAITLVDKSVTPNYSRTFYIDKLKVSDLNSDPEQVSLFAIEGRSNEYAKFALKGDVKPFSTKMNLNVDGFFKELSLPAVSTYVKDSLGFELQSGQFDTELKINIVESNIKGDAQLQLRGLDMTAANDVETASLRDQTAIPLNAALDMLKDGNGNIALDLPMSGSVDDPEFGISSFIGLIAKKAIYSAAKSYLIQTFVPYANVVSVAMSAGEYLLSVSFEDLPFIPGSKEISSDQQAYIDQFINLLKEKPELQVKVCGIATTNEFNALIANTQADANKTENGDINHSKENQESALRQLAKTRSENFKKFVIDKGKIDSARLLICSAQIDSGEKAIPRIEFAN